MHEILQQIQPSQRVLDLGCAQGSFPDAHCAGQVFRCDLDAHLTTGRFARADARALPFSDHCFDAVILNHSLEHFPEPARVLQEIRRVIRSPAYLYIAVPDSTTLMDRVYRWLGRGGGHVNPFDDPAVLVRTIEQNTGLPHSGSRVLFSSFSFMNRRNIPGRLPKRLYLLGGGAEWSLRLATFFFRNFDRRFKTRSSVYGWAFCFGPDVHFDPRPRTNVCIRCGSGHRSADLSSAGLRPGPFGWRSFTCSNCGTSNFFTDDAPYSDFR